VPQQPEISVGIQRPLPPPLTRRSGVTQCQPTQIDPGAIVTCRYVVIVKESNRKFKLIYNDSITLIYIILYVRLL